MKRKWSIADIQRNSVVVEHQSIIHQQFAQNNAMCGESNTKAFVVNSRKVFDTNNFSNSFRNNDKQFAVPFFFYAQILSTLSLWPIHRWWIPFSREWVHTHYASTKLMNQTHLLLLLWIVYTSWQPNSLDARARAQTDTNLSLYSVHTLRKNDRNDECNWNVYVIK